MNNTLENLIKYPIISDTKGNVVCIWSTEGFIDPEDHQEFIRTRFDDRYLAFKCPPDVSLRIVREFRKSIVRMIVNDRKFNRRTNENN